jgi:hypothetical protein
MAEANASLAEIANQLGHGDINVTATYAADKDRRALPRSCKPPTPRMTPDEPVLLRRE